MNLSDIPDYFQSSSLEELSMRTIFRALVSRYLLEAVFSRMPRDIEDLRACITSLASELNLIVKARPRSPATFYSPVQGDVISKDNARLFQGNRRQFGEVQITLLLGIKPAGIPSRPYAAAQVELSRSEEA
ncbi:hypothetical protein ACHAP3_005706 [Botrytis cinerea]